MRLYTVHHQPNRAAASQDPNVVLIKEGFCWPALLIPLLWLLYRKQFWGLVVYLTLTLALATIAAGLDMNETTAFLLTLVLSLLVAAQANDWRRWRLETRGYDLVGVVAADSLAQAEEIYFRNRWRGSDAAPEVKPAPVHTPLPASRLTPFATPFDPA